MLMPLFCRVGIDDATDPVLRSLTCSRWVFRCWTPANQWKLRSVTKGR